MMALRENDPTPEARAALGRALDRYIYRMIRKARELSYSYDDIAKTLGLERETVLDIGITDISSALFNKKNSTLTVDERARRNKIILLLYSKGATGVMIAKDLQLSEQAVCTIIRNYESIE